MDLWTQKLSIALTSVMYHRARTFTPKERNGASEPPKFDHTHDEIALVHLELEHGETVSLAELGRTWKWVRTNKLEVGSQVYLDKPEMGMVGWPSVRQSQMDRDD